MKQTKQQKVRGSKFMFKMSTIHTNTCIQTTMPLRSQCRDDGVVQQPSLPQQTFFKLFHIMDPQAVDPLLKHTPDAVVNYVLVIQQIRRSSNCKKFLVREPDEMDCMWRIFPQ